MPLGDYEKTIYTEDTDTTPEILNNNENKTKELDTELLAHQAETMPHQDSLQSYGSAEDSKGRPTVIDYKRKSDGTLYMKSTLSNTDANLNYQTDTWKFYDNAGTTVIKTVTWTFTYSSKNKILNKTYVVS